MFLNKIHQRCLQIVSFGLCHGHKYLLQQKQRNFYLTMHPLFVLTRMLDFARDSFVNHHHDCQILFVASIGGPAAAKVVRYGIHPIKKPQAGSALDEIKALQSVIGKDAPPWLSKVMGQSHEQRIRFDKSNIEQE